MDVNIEFKSKLGKGVSQEIDLQSAFVSRCWFEIPFKAAYKIYWIKITFW